MKSLPTRRMAKLTAAQIPQIMCDYMALRVELGIGNREMKKGERWAICRCLGQRHGVKATAIDNILCRRSWGFIDVPENWVPYA